LSWLKAEASFSERFILFEKGSSKVRRLYNFILAPGRRRKPLQAIDAGL
jgi:hypothetical protein